MSNTYHRIDIEPVSLGQRGQLYLVRHDGAVLVAGSWNPEFDACRLLLAKGISGKLEVWHKDGTFPAMRLDIIKSASLTVEESERVGPRFARWYPRSDEANGKAVSASSGCARTATDDNPAGYPPAKKSAVFDRPPPPNSILLLDPAVARGEGLGHASSEQSLGSDPI